MSSVKIPQMIPAGYLAKRVVTRPDWIKTQGIDDIYSVSGCISESFADYINFWKHNGWWLFDSPQIIRDVARENNIDLGGVQFFYYEVYGQEFDEDDRAWSDFSPETSFTTNIQVPRSKRLEGYDVVTFIVHTIPECSPLSCNSLAESIAVNRHCLLESFDEAKAGLEEGRFDKSEPGPYRIFAVYSLPDEPA